MKGESIPVSSPAPGAGSSSLSGGRTSDGRTSSRTRPSIGLDSVEVVTTIPGPLASSRAWRDHFWTKNRRHWRVVQARQELAGGIAQSQVDDPPELTREERDTIAGSIAQFQLGEGSQGKRLLDRGREWGRLASDPDFITALAEFITEEQKHSYLLGEFMDREGIPRLRRHWVDGVFRHLRVLGELEWAVTVLVSAEVIAVPYYRALRAATNSPCLRTICNEILRDESEHLIYQGRTLALVRGPEKSMNWIAHRGLMEGTLHVVWAEHGRVFRRAGYSFTRFRKEALEAFEVLRSVSSICHHSYRLERSPALRQGAPA